MYNIAVWKQNSVTAPWWWAAVGVLNTPLPNPLIISGRIWAKLKPQSSLPKMVSIFSFSFNDFDFVKVLLFLIVWVLASYFMPK